MHKNFDSGSVATVRVPKDMKNPPKIFETTSDSRIAVTAPDDWKLTKSGKVVTVTAKTGEVSGHSHVVHVWVPKGTARPKLVRY